MSVYSITSRQKKTSQKTTLSVLIPYFRDDPTELLSALLEQTGVDGRIEIYLYDDGTNDSKLSEKVVSATRNARLKTTVTVAKENKGRSAARNHLQSQTQTEWLLFLDADMRPGSGTFLLTYLDLIDANVADIIFGGFTVPSKANTPAQELHRVFSETSDCLSAQQRLVNGPQYVASSNLCVKKTVLHEEQFDDGFSGWGWEDSEWAARCAKRFTLLHVENTALHLGLETDKTLLRRFKDSAINYVRFTQTHPKLAQTLPLFRLSQRLRKIPGQKMLRPLLKLIVIIRVFPITIRILALKLWRASWYAEAFS